MLAGPLISDVVLYYETEGRLLASFRTAHDTKTVGRNPERIGAPNSAPNSSRANLGLFLLACQIGGGAIQMACPVDRLVGILKSDLAAANSCIEAHGVDVFSLAAQPCEPPATLGYRLRLCSPCISLYKVSFSSLYPFVAVL